MTLRGKLFLQYGKDPFDCGTGRVQRRQDLHHPVHAAPRGPVAVMEVEDTLIAVFVTTAEWPQFPHSSRASLLLSFHLESWSFDFNCRGDKICFF